MPPLPIIVVLAAIVVFAALALVVYLRRRRAAEAKIAASMPMEQLTETDIAWRIGLLDDRPIGLSDYFAGAELSELFAGADKESVEPVVEESESPLLPAIPAAAALAATSEPAVPAAPGPKFVLKSPAAALKAAAPPTAAFAAVPVAAVAAKTAPKARTSPPSRRYRLYRDSATVLLGAILVVLLVTTVAPSLTAQPLLTTDGPESANPVAIVITEPPTGAPSVEPASGQVTGPSSSPANVTSPSPAATPKATPKPTPRRTPRPTPRPTLRPQVTPAPTPKPTPKPTPRPTPRPTPPSRTRPAAVVTCSTLGGWRHLHVQRCSNPQDDVTRTAGTSTGRHSRNRSFSHDYSNDPAYNPGDHTSSLTLQGPGGTTSKFR